MVDIQSPTAEVRRGKKKKEEERNHRAKIMACPILHRAAIKRIVAERSSSGEWSPINS